MESNYVHQFKSAEIKYGSIHTNTELIEINNKYF